MVNACGKAFPVRQKGLDAVLSQIRAPGPEIVHHPLFLQ
jgi:hypothetical protein